MSFLYNASLTVLLSAISVGGSTAQPSTSNKSVGGAGTKPAANERSREMAYKKLMEGQRYMWNAGRQQDQAENLRLNSLAKASLLQAVELDPKLAEGYTALAEVTLTTTGNVAEAIAYATKGVAASADNFGSRRILARLYTFRSSLNTPEPDAASISLAIKEWEYVGKLDPRNAEAWAFLNALYERTGKQDLQVEVLKKWISSTPPTDRQFYRRVMGAEEDLTPENASMKLAALYLKMNRTKEAISLISTIISDEPNSTEAVQLMREALESSDAETARSAADALRQAVYLNPSNASMVVLLADVETRAGDRKAAIELLSKAADGLAAKQPDEASSLAAALGDVYFADNRFPEAIKAYNDALLKRGIDATGKSQVRNTDPEFTAYIFDKIVNVHKAANNTREVIATLERARKVLGPDNSFADNQLILYYRESGRRSEAIDLVRSLRIKSPSDANLARLEASLLAENGQIDEAVANFTKFAATAGGREQNPGSVTFPPPGRDVFSDNLFISQLYTQAGRNEKAIEWANKAVLSAKGTERKQLGRLTLATAQQMNKDFQGAETTLRDILKESPSNPIALNNLGYFLLERGECIDEALTMIKAAVRVDPTNPSYLDSLGWAYFAKGDLKEAEKHLVAASRLDTSSATIQEHLGDVYEKQGDLVKAKLHWEKALKLASEKEQVDRLRKKIGR